MLQEFMGFDWIWWMGRVEDVRDPKEMARVKVRIYGLHSQDYQKLPTTKLPWAQPLMPCTSASQGGVGHSPSGLQVGSWVMGFFADGRRGQFPIVLGTFHGVHATAYTRSDGAGVASGMGPSGAVNTPINAAAAAVAAATAAGGATAGAAGAAGTAAGAGTTGSAIYTGSAGSAISGGSNAALPSTNQTIATTTRIDAASPIWSGAPVYADGSGLSQNIINQKSAILETPSSQVFMGTLYAADAVSTYAQNVDGVQMIVPSGGGVDPHSANHSTGESIDMVPANGWDYAYTVQNTTTGQVFNQAQMYGTVASAYGADRMGIPQLESGSTTGLHVQMAQDPSIGGSGNPAAVWGYPGSGSTAFGSSGSYSAVSPSYLANFQNGGGFTPSQIPNINDTLTTQDPFNTSTSNQFVGDTSTNANPNPTGTPYIAGSSGSYGAGAGQYSGINPTGEVATPANTPTYDAFNPMNEYSGEAVSLAAAAKSTDNATNTTKGDLNTSQNTTRGDAPYQSGDNSAFAEPLSPDVGKYHSVQCWLDSQMNGMACDSTPGANRVKITGPSTSYVEWNDQGSKSERVGGDSVFAARGNVSFGADTNLALTAGKGNMRMYSAGNVDVKAEGSHSIDASGGLNLNSLGSSVLKFSGDLVFQARSIKFIADGGGMDFRSGDEINLEAGAGMNLQSGADMALESKGGMAQAAHGDWNAKADGKAILGSGGDTSVKSGGALKMTSAGDSNVTGTNVNLQGANINCKGTTKADVFSSPAAPLTPPPVGGGAAPGGAAAADDPATALKAKSDGNGQNGRAQGSGGGGVAASARAAKTIDLSAQEGTPSTQTASSVIPPPVSSSYDHQYQVDDAAPYTAGP